MTITSPFAIDSTGAREDARVEGAIRDLILHMGDDPDREGLAKTPQRVRTSLATLSDGYGASPLSVVGDALFKESSRGMVTVRDIEFYSMCEHHILPFYGRVQISYLPDGLVVGLSKLPRLVDIFAHRLQVQERMTAQIAEAVADVTRARGVGVVVEGFHLCMMMRGVAKQHSSTHTSEYVGEFESSQDVREQMFRAITRN
ncbi:GTP cyclohydrolase I FolE [Streptomyces sp. NPDC127178]|uniref:GTP cyclohydrolase I FolE n=1 Tax=unclassified Streptomyces TaxID=2593676 RepID=UPI00362ABD91